MGSDMWFRAMEQRMSELIDEDVPERAAYAAASDQANVIIRDKLSDAADMACKIAKGE